MDLPAVISSHLPSFLLVLLRASVFLAVLPVLGSKVFPARFRIGLAVALALVLTPVVEFTPRRDGIPGMVAAEVALGMALGLAARFIFLAVEIAGQIASDAMGMSIATVFNPEMGSSTEIAHLQSIAATLLFLATDSHHELIAIFARSYELLPAGTFRSDMFLPQAVAIMGKMFVMAAKLCTPVIVGVLTANLVMGFVYKATPQINVFFAAYPLFLFLGLLIILLSIPAFMSAVGGSFADMRVTMMNVLAAGR